MYRSLMVRKTHVPWWLSEVFIKACEDVRYARAKSWDDVFGRPFAKGVHVSRLGHRWSKALSIWKLVTEARARDEPVDDHLFRKVGKHVGVSTTVAKDIYYVMKAADDAVRAGTADPDGPFIPRNL
jgi:hypothetical protein